MVDHLPQEQTSIPTYPSSWPDLPDQLKLIDDEAFTDGSSEFTFESTIADIRLRISGPHEESYTISVQFDGVINDSYCHTTEEFCEQLADIYAVFGCDQIIHNVYGHNIGSFIKGLDFRTECIYGLTDILEVIEKPYSECVFDDFKGFFPREGSVGGELRVQYTLHDITQPSSTDSEVYVFDNYQIAIGENKDDFELTYIPNSTMGFDWYLKLTKEKTDVTTELHYVDEKHRTQALSEFI